VGGSFGSIGAPFTSRWGSMSAAAFTRTRASLRGIRAIACTNFIVLPYPNPTAILRDSVSVTTESICAQVECIWVSNAPSSASTSASLLCHTATVDMTPLYDGPPTRPGASAGLRGKKFEKIWARQRQRIFDNGVSQCCPAALIRTFRQWSVESLRWLRDTRCRRSICQTPESAVLLTSVYLLCGSPGLSSAWPG
jgi:hypothetical protein